MAGRTWLLPKRLAKTRSGWPLLGPAVAHYCRAKPTQAGIIVINNDNTSEKILDKLVLFFRDIKNNNVFLKGNLTIILRLFVYEDTLKTHKLLHKSIKLMP